MTSFLPNRNRWFELPFPSETDFWKEGNGARRSLVSLNVDVIWNESERNFQGDALLEWPLMLTHYLEEKTTFPWLECPIVMTSLRTNETITLNRSLARFKWPNWLPFSSRTMHFHRNRVGWTWWCWEKNHAVEFHNRCWWIWKLNLLPPWSSFLCNDYVITRNNLLH